MDTVYERRPFSTYFFPIFFLLQKTETEAGGSSRKGISARLRATEETVEVTSAGRLKVTGENFTGKLLTLLPRLERRLGSFSAVINARSSIVAFLA